MLLNTNSSELPCLSISMSSSTSLETWKTCCCLRVQYVVHSEYVLFCIGFNMFSGLNWCESSYHQKKLFVLSWWNRFGVVYQVSYIRRHVRSFVHPFIQGICQDLLRSPTLRAENHIRPTGRQTPGCCTVSSPCPFTQLLWWSWYHLASNMIMYIWSQLIYHNCSWPSVLRMATAHQLVSSTGICHRDLRLPRQRGLLAGCQQGVGRGEVPVGCIQRVQ